MSVTNLIDGDGIAHIASRVSKDYDEEGFARDEETVEANVDAFINNIFHHLENEHNVTVDEYKIFLSGEGNFRKTINPEYKANRRDTIYPPMLGYAKEYLTKSWNAFTVNGAEADDSIVATWWSILSSPLLDLENDIVIISSFDKDFKTVPCVFFDYYHSRMSLEVISEESANRFFFSQMIEGDTADNIKGIPRKGKAAAKKALDGVTSTFGMRRKVYDMYKEKFGKKARREYEKNFLMLYLRRDGVATPAEFEKVIL
tara:strand:- start:1531 stop:2304 length:774 start_codon:yes stop_codon:yes gene_type:complete